MKAIQALISDLTLFLTKGNQLPHGLAAKY